jgi:hypothetical protein
VADADVIVHSTTIYPGWYRGRTVHIHLTVHVDKKTVLTTQLCMDDTVNDAVFATAPYGEHTGRDTGNDDDHIFDPSGPLSLRTSGDGYPGVPNPGVDVQGRRGPAVDCERSSVARRYEPRLHRNVSDGARARRRPGPSAPPTWRRQGRRRTRRPP